MVEKEVHLKMPPFDYLVINVIYLVTKWIPIIVYYNAYGQKYN